MKTCNQAWQLHVHYMLLGQLIIGLTITVITTTRGQTTSSSINNSSSCLTKSDSSTDMYSACACASACMALRPPTSAAARHLINRERSDGLSRYRREDYIAQRTRRR